MEPDRFVVVMRFSDFSRETFLALWLVPIVCFVVSAFLFWWGMR